MTCVVCYVTRRGHKKLVSCSTCVAKWCTACHVEMVEAFVRSTFDNLEDLDVRSHGLQCPCCRTVMNSSAVHVHDSKKGYLRHYLDGIFQYGQEVQLIDRTKRWLRRNSTWISATSELDRRRRQITRFERLVGELEHLIGVYQTIRSKPQDVHRCSAGGQSNDSLERLQAQCRELYHIKDRKIQELGRLMAQIPELFARYSRVIPSPKATVLEALDTMNDDATYRHFAKHFEPITFFTMLPLRVECILGLKSKAEHLLSIIHFCRKRSIILDLAHDLQVSCRKTSHAGRTTGVRRWLIRTEPSECPVDAQLQFRFMSCVSRITQVDYALDYALDCANRCGDLVPT